MDSEKPYKIIMLIYITYQVGIVAIMTINWRYSDINNA